MVIDFKTADQPGKITVILPKDPQGKKLIMRIIRDKPLIVEVQLVDDNELSLAGG